MAQTESFGSLIDQVNQDWDYYLRLNLDFKESDSHTDFWNKDFRKLNQKVQITSKAQPKKLKNFRKKMLGVRDNPSTGRYSILRLLGMFRGESEMMKRCLTVVEEMGYAHLLEKYACPTVGNPIVYKTKNYRATHRWLKHIYHLGTLDEVLKDRLEPGFTSVDIGSSFGGFSYLLHKHYEGSHHILVDLPEQLLFARYFLGQSFPYARIAGPKEISSAEKLDRQFVEKFDFLLVPPSYYDKFEPGSVDLVTSFACLGELKRVFFDFYVNAPVFRSAKYLYTANPVDQYNMFGTDITLFDYPILDHNKRLHFRISPIFKFMYGLPSQRGIFGYELRRIFPFFECITELQLGNIGK